VNSLLPHKRAERCLKPVRFTDSHVKKSWSFIRPSRSNLEENSQLETYGKHKADLAKFIGIAKMLDQHSRNVEMTVDCFILQ
jgi:hypothetical protein